MEDHSGLHLYSTTQQKAQSESNSEGREADLDNSDFILQPSGDNNIVPDLRTFVKTPRLLTREGRDQLRSLRATLGGPYGQRRVERLNENIATPQSIETPPRSLTTQTETNLPRQSEKRKPLQKLFG